MEGRVLVYRVNPAEERAQTTFRSIQLRTPAPTTEKCFRQ